MRESNYGVWKIWNHAARLSELVPLKKSMIVRNLKHPGFDASMPRFLNPSQIPLKDIPKTFDSRTVWKKILCKKGKSFETKKSMGTGYLPISLHVSGLGFGHKSFGTNILHQTIWPFTPGKEWPAPQKNPLKLGCSMAAKCSISSCTWRLRTPGWENMRKWWCWPWSNCH